MRQSIYFENTMAFGYVKHFFFLENKKLFEIIKNDVRKSVFCKDFKNIHFFFPNDSVQNKFKNKIVFFK